MKQIMPLCYSLPAMWKGIWVEREANGRRGKARELYQWQVMAFSFAALEWKSHYRFGINRTFTADLN